MIRKDRGRIGRNPHTCEQEAGISSRATRQRRTGMALKVELKPHERIIIGACVVTNSDQRARLLIDGDRIPILREKDILTPETADTPAKLVYLAVQLMYLSPDPMAHHPTYFSLVRDVLTAMPSAWPYIEGINNFILNGDLYHALKEAKKLIGHEEKLIESARKLQEPQADDPAGRKSA
jgi:flagellar protein FlbT